MYGVLFIASLVMPWYLLRVYPRKWILHESSHGGELVSWPMVTLDALRKAQSKQFIAATLCFTTLSKAS